MSIIDIQDLIVPYGIICSHKGVALFSSSVRETPVCVSGSEGIPSVSYKNIVIVQTKSQLFYLFFYQFFQPSTIYTQESISILN